MKLSKFLIAGLIFFLSSNVYAEDVEVKSESKDRVSLSVTIYNENLALVKDKRNLNLDKGINNIAFTEVSGEIKPETSIVKGSGISVLEQNFNFDLLTPEKILQKAVGSKVKLINVNPATGEQTIEDAELLSAVGRPVLRIGDRIETNYPGRIVFDSVPKNLRDKPTLTLMINSENAGQNEMELGYLTRGLGWKADYVAELNDSDDSLDLNGWVTLTNSSGVDYEKASLQLVAGDVNVVREHFMAPRMAKAVMMEADNSFGGGMQEEGFSDFHLYSLGRPTTIASNQTKQVSLLSASNVKTNREYKMESPFGIYNGNSGDFENINANIYQKFFNKEDNNLGMPLPKGTIRVYKSDSKGKMVFAGEDSVVHTPKNEEIKLKLGSAFDITASGKQTEYKRISNHSFENSYELTIKNAKDQDVVVNVHQRISGDWRILAESIKNEQVNSGEVLWSVPVKASGETKLTFTLFVNN